MSQIVLLVKRVNERGNVLNYGYTLGGHAGLTLVAIHSAR
jgi:hypothetical protein